MTNQHPITPPDELVQQWCHEDGDEIKTSPRWYRIFATKAAQWGYQQAAGSIQQIVDEELEACCEWAQGYAECGDALRLARRPKLPSLKGQALDALGPEPRPKTGPTGVTILNHGAIKRHRLVRRALEQLND